MPTTDRDHQLVVDRSWTLPTILSLDFPEFLIDGEAQVRPV